MNDESPGASLGRGRVVVVGAINVDLVVAAPRLPGAGETVVGDGLTRHGGGKGANAAVAAARAGAAVRFLGALGTDAEAREAERDLLAVGVDCEGVARLAERPTGVALIVVDPGGENQIAVGAGANHGLSAAHVEASLERIRSDLDCVLVSTEIPGAAVSAAVRGAARAGVPCVLNPAPVIPAVLELLEHGPILTPNRDELAHLREALVERGPEPAVAADRFDDSDSSDDDESVAAGVRALSARTGAAVCVTLGAGGVLVADGGSVTRIDASRVCARDTTGAGDTFNGVLAAWLAGGATLADAARAATCAASLSVQAVGARAGMPDRRAILERLSA